MSSFGFYGTNADPQELLRQRNDDVGMEHARQEALYERHMEERHEREELDRQAEDERRRDEAFQTRQFEEFLERQYFESLEIMHGYESYEASD